MQRLPNLTVDGRQELFNNLLFADYDAEAVNFYRYQGIDGGRFSVNPRVTLPWRWGDYLIGYGTIGSQAVLYDTAGKNMHITPVGDTPLVTAANSTCPGRGGVQLTFNNCVSLDPFGNDGLSARLVPYANAGVSTFLIGFTMLAGSRSRNSKTRSSRSSIMRMCRGSTRAISRCSIRPIGLKNARSLITYGFTTRLFAKDHK